MLEWLQAPVAGEHLGGVTIAVRLVFAALAGLAVAAIYKASQTRSDNSHSLMTTLVLLTVLVAMTTVVIGDSIARAFGLVGALSIVRFRTVVEDTRDTAFVIFAVVVGMALGAGNWTVCLIGMPVVAAAAIGLGRINGAAPEVIPQKKLEIRFGAGNQPEAALAGAAFDLVYLVRLQDSQGLLPLVKAIHAIDGVQSVEVRDA
jgi:hypothetical protein